MAKYEIINVGNEKHPKALISFSDVTAGDIGGVIAGYHSLSQLGDCWVYEAAQVDDNAMVFDDAKLIEGRLTDNAKLYGKATVISCDYIGDDAEVFDNAVIDNSEIVVCTNAKVYGNATITNEGIIKDNVEVYGNAKLLLLDTGVSILLTGNAKIVHSIAAVMIGDCHFATCSIADGYFDYGGFDGQGGSESILHANNAEEYATLEWSKLSLEIRKEIYDKLTKEFAKPDIAKLQDYNISQLRTMSRNMQPQQQERSQNIDGITYVGFEANGDAYFYCNSEDHLKEYDMLVRFFDWKEIKGRDDVLDLLTKSNIGIWCSCPSFQFWGAAYKATVNQYGIVKETRAPKEPNKQKKDNFWLCKHTLALMRAMPFWWPKILKDIKANQIKQLDKPQQELKAKADADMAKQKEGNA